jgi:hypothetical protein
LRDAKISVLEVHARVLQPFVLSLILSSDKERAQKVMARLEGWALLLGLRASARARGD